jgi:hypothetical protein
MVAPALALGGVGLLVENSPVFLGAGTAVIANYASGR